MRGLTRKREEVLRLMAEGMTTRQIADRFGNSIKTIERIRHDLFMITRAKNAVQLISMAYENNWLKMEKDVDKQTGYYTIADYAIANNIEMDCSVFEEVTTLMPKVCSALCEDIGRIGNIDLYSETVLRVVFILEVG